MQQLWVVFEDRFFLTKTVIVPSFVRNPFLTGHRRHARKLSTSAGFPGGQLDREAASKNDHSDRIIAIRLTIPMFSGFTGSARSATAPLSVTAQAPATRR
jgi:hypothetical protein